MYHSWSLQMAEYGFKVDPKTQIFEKMKKNKRFLLKLAMKTVHLSRPQFQYRSTSDLTT